MIDVPFPDQARKAEALKSKHVPDHQPSNARPASDPLYRSPAANGSGRGPASGSWRHDKGKLLMWLCMLLLGAISGIGVWLWQREVARGDLHADKLWTIQVGDAVRDSELRAMRAVLDEVRMDMKQLLRQQAPAK